MEKMEQRMGSRRGGRNTGGALVSGWMRGSRGMQGWVGSQQVLSLVFFKGTGGPITSPTLEAWFSQRVRGGS